MKKYRLSAFLSGLLAAAMIATAFPAAAMADSPVDLALGKQFIAINYGGSSEDSYPSDPDRNSIATADAESIGRLTDGIIVPQSEYKHFEENWVGGLWNETGRTRGRYVNFYRGDSRDLILDLGAESNVTSIAMHAGACQPYGIAYPESMTYYLSEDGVTYHKVGTVTANEARLDTNECIAQGDEPPMTHKYYEIAGLNYNARYVRVQFTVPVWVFADELLVMGFETASGAPDTLPSGEGDILVEETPVNSYATPAQSGGVQNEYLAYQGWGMVSGNLVPTYKPVEEYKTVVAYVDENGTARDWLYDAITVTGHGYASDGTYDTYRNGANSPTQYAQKSDWKEWLDHVFDYTHEGALSNMDALEEAVAVAKGELQPGNGLSQSDINDHKVKVKMSMTPPVHIQNDWGTATTAVAVQIDASGITLTTGPAADVSLDFTLAGHDGNVEAALSDRATAIKWYIDEIIRRFEEKNYENIVLDGFYYHDETIRMTADPLAEQTIKIYNMLIADAAVEHGVGKYYSYWIPFYQAEGFKRWSEFGFDYAIMQPNLMFDDSATPTRIDSSAGLSYKYGLGVEMEYAGTAADKLNGFHQYLAKGATLGYQGSVQAWYWGTWDPYNIALGNNKATHRYLYDLVYDYIKGDRVFDNNLLAEEGANVSILSRDPAQSASLSEQAAKLADGVNMDGWSDANGVQINGNQVAGPIEIIGELASAYQINSLELNFCNGPASSGIGVPSCATFFASADGVKWTRLGVVSELSGEESDPSRSFVLSAPGINAKYVKAQFQFAPDTKAGASSPFLAWVGVGEFFVNGTPATAATAAPSLEGASLVSSTGLTVAAADKDTVTPSKGSLAVLADGRKDTNLWSGDDDYFAFTRAAAEGPFTLVADLGEDCVITGFGLNFYQWYSAGVGSPAEVVYYTSTDGSAWTKAGTVSRPVLTRLGEGSDVYGVDFVLALSSNKTARYVKAEFARGLDTYAQKGDVYGWVAMDEFTVTGTTVRDPDVPLPLEGENLLSGEMLSITAEGILNQGEFDKAQAALRAGILTDGVYGGKWNYKYNDITQSAYIGFVQGHAAGPYILTADLGGEYTITGLAIDFYHDTAGSGLYKPDEVVYSVSADGQTWTALPAVVKPLVSLLEGQVFKADYILRPAAPVTARYLKAEFQRGTREDRPDGTLWSWIGFDEWKVTGSEGGTPVVTYQVAASAVNGTASVSPAQVAAGGSAVLTFAPNSGCRLEDVAVNGVSIGKVASPYTVTNIQADTTIAVTFGKIPSASTPSYGYTGSDAPNPAAPTEIDVDDVKNELNDPAKAQALTLLSQPDVVEGDLFEAAIAANKPISFAVVDDNGSTVYQWTFAPQELVNPQIAMGLGINFSKLGSALNSEIQRLAPNQEGLVLDFLHTGILPGAAKVKVRVEGQFANGTVLRFYYYNPSASRLELASDGIRVVDGYAEFPLLHCSQYLLTADPVPGAWTKAETTENPKTGDAGPVLPLAAAAGMLALGVFLWWRRSKA